MRYFFVSLYKGIILLISIVPLAIIHIVQIFGDCPEEKTLLIKFMEKMRI